MSHPLFQTLTEMQVTLSPAGVNEYPFFCLSRRPAHLKRNIEWRGADSEGRQFTWKVKPNSDGLPGEAAWEIWLTIIQPLLHASQPLRHGLLIPLGGVRHCLRVLGWTISGANARVLTRALSQVAGATIEFDLWLPLLQPKPEGENFRRVRGRGPRILFYSIGEYQVSEAELQSGELAYDYDLNDVISIRVALEADLQQNVQYRPLDQVYVRSVCPSARRWYELTAASVFGAVSHPNSRGYFDVRYSWYVSRHHTLEAQTGLRRIKMQMEKITKDHLKSGYLRKVEYFETSEGDDVIIRYFPGAGAKRSINRVKSLLSGRRGLISVGDEQVDSVPAPPPDSEAEALILKMISEYSLIEKIARRLVEENAEEARKQVEAYPYRKAKPDNPAAFLVQSIREKWPLPEKYLAALARKANDVTAQSQTEAERTAAMLAEAIECLQRAVANINDSEKPGLYDACSAAERELDDLRDHIAAGGECLLEDIENKLTAAENRITEALWQSTDPEELEAMLKSARAELQKYKARMEPEVFNETLRRAVTARLREQHRIPRLSLFYL
ncbi:MAG: hypothetical protein MOB07_25440 [Acidobacteria bacterium]|nr:hypothetical protein [Acidobacteriota bacterium]